jgi:chaperonin GroEL
VAKTETRGALSAADRRASQNDDERVGIEIVRKAVQTPLRQIAESAGEDGAVISGKILDRDEYNWGFDAQTGEFKDLVKAGIVDPTKVVRTALQDAASVAGLLVTTEAMVAEKPEKKAPAMPGGGGMGGMGDMDY